MTKSLEKILDRMKDGSAMSASVVCGGMTVAVIREGVFRQRKPKPVGYAWCVSTRARHAGSIFITPNDRAVLICLDETPHVRVDINVPKCRKIGKAVAE